MRAHSLWLAAAPVAALLLGSCGGKGAAGRETVLYCSVDEDQFRPLIEAYSKESGARVNAVGETEATRSVGMARKVEMEKDHPVADVLWANEIMNTVVLRDLGCFAPLPSGLADSIPARWRDPKGQFVAFGGRARIILVNTKLLPDKAQWPTSMDDLLDPKWGTDGRRPTIARPLTGTTYAHAVAMLTADEARAKAFWTAVAERGAKGEVKVVPSNGATKNAVAKGEGGVAWGLTDTDDARAAIAAGDPVAVVYPDQAEGKPGTLVIPNTAALIRGGPNPAGGEALLRWLASPDNEARLARTDIANIPLREEVAALRAERAGG
jgi:iron(III) transport system substrate-binding protein